METDLKERELRTKHRYGKEGGKHKRKSIAGKVNERPLMCSLIILIGECFSKLYDVCKVLEVYMIIITRYKSNNNSEISREDKNWVCEEVRF